MFGTYDLVHSLPSCTKALLNRYSTLQAGHVHCPIYQELESVCVSLEHISGSLCKSRRDPGILANHKCIKLCLWPSKCLYSFANYHFSPQLSAVCTSPSYTFLKPQLVVVCRLCTFSLYYKTFSKDSLDQRVSGSCFELPPGILPVNSARECLYFLNEPACHHSCN